MRMRVSNATRVNSEMQIDLDLSSLYYFVWSIAMLAFFGSVGTLMEKIYTRVDDLLQAVRAAERAAKYTNPV
jgi:hypothetical protein